jgi:hypothetical protein
MARLRACNAPRRNRAKPLEMVGLGQPSLNGIPFGKTWFVEFPLWFPPAVAMALTLCAARSQRRGGAGHLCPACGYDLSGLPPGSPCPECATIPTN